MTLSLTPRAANDAASNLIPGGVLFNDFSGTGVGPNSQAIINIDSNQGEILGTTTGTAVVSDVSGSLQGYLRGLVKLASTTINSIVPGSQIPSGSAAVTMMQPVTGSYRMSLNSGTLSAGLSAGTTLWSMRYGGTGFALIRRMRISAGNTATAFTAGATNFSLYAARSYTINDSGGTQATLTGNNGKLRTSYGTNNISDMRIASTGSIVPGSRTLDSTALCAVSGAVPATAGTMFQPVTSLFVRDTSDEIPVILAQNEGLVLQGTVPATGTWVLSVEVDWDEVANY